MQKLFAIAICVLIVNQLTGQNRISSKIEELKSKGHSPELVSLCQYETNDIHNRDFKLENISQGTLIHLDDKVMSALNKGHHTLIRLLLPISERESLVLTLYEQEILAPDFILRSSASPDDPIPYQRGKHFRGIVEGKPNSLVGLSVFEDEVIALISTEEGTWTLGRIAGDSGITYLLYQEKDLLDHDFTFNCETSEEGVSYTEEQLSDAISSRDINDCVRVYVEVDNDIVTAQGGVIPATNYISAILNQCIVIYANEQINMVVSEIKVWATTSPYTGESSGAMLNSFQANTEMFNGDIGQLISFDSLFGGQAAGLSGICPSSPDLSKCFSGIRHNYDIVPIFSWPVFVISHEMGHLLGSNHTHACVWNGNNTKIDGCGGTGGCAGGIIPPEGGTIMSYCYPSNGSFINFTLGFGPQPGNVIRNTVNSASNCLSPCGQPETYCASNGAAGTGEYINKIVLANVNNLSGNNDGYADFTAITANLNAGSTYTATLTPKFTGGNNTKYWRIYIDYNQDLDWYDAGECVAQGAGSNAINLTFTVPTSIPALSTRMRVAMKLAGYPAFCGAFPLGEVEDYTIIVTGTTPTCSDGVQNQGETGVDCGGPCPACATCEDGLQNQGETGIDCGGPCPACPVGDSTLLLGAYFESGWDGWLDGGSDVARVNGPYAYEGIYSIRIADNSGAQSTMTSPFLNFSNAAGAMIKFHFIASSMENNEDFFVQYNNGSGTWNTIGTYIAGVDFNNGIFYNASLLVPNFTPTSTGSFRIQCDASDNNDQVYIDAVLIYRLDGLEYAETGLTIASPLKPQEQTDNLIHKNGEDFIHLYPNPADNEIIISLNRKILFGYIVSSHGKNYYLPQEKFGNTPIDISFLVPGLYFISIQTESGCISTGFIKI